MWNMGIRSMGLEVPNSDSRAIRSMSLFCGGGGFLEIKIMPLIKEGCFSSKTCIYQWRAVNGGFSSFLIVLPRLAHFNKDACQTLVDKNIYYFEHVLNQIKMVA